MKKPVTVTMDEHLIGAIDDYRKKQKFQINMSSFISAACDKFLRNELGVPYIYKSEKWKSKE